VAVALMDSGDVFASQAGSWGPSELWGKRVVDDDVDYMW